MEKLSRKCDGICLRGGSNTTEKNFTTWSINVGGCSGAWKLMDHLGNLQYEQRPQLIGIQEVSSRRGEWMAMQGTINSLGYRCFACDDLWQSNGRRSVAILIKAGYPVHQEFQTSSECGSAIAISVRDTLFLCSYVRPRGEAIVAHCGALEEQLRVLHWVGQSVWMGDWNEVFQGSNLEVLAHDFSMMPISVSTDATRWSGRRIIDYFLC